MPRVTVVLPTHNRLEKLQHALLGVRSQTFQDFELIVIVDGSTDDTIEWLSTNATDARLLIVEKAIGAAAARNCGIESARGEFVAFLDDDDFWKPSYLEAQVAHLDLHREAELSYSDHVEIDGSGRTFVPDTQPLLIYGSPVIGLLTECYIHTLSVVVCRQRLFTHFGGFDAKLAIVHDLDWYARVLAGGTTFVRLPDRLVERERGVPGGLVTRHRTWFQEEREVLTRILRDCPHDRKHERMIRAYRSLFFASLGFAQGDLIFGLARLSEAFLHSVHWTTRVAALRLWRRLQFVQGSSTHEYTR